MSENVIERLDARVSALAETAGGAVRVLGGRVTAAETALASAVTFETVDAGGDGVATAWANVRPATADALGGVIVGDGLDVADDGTLSADLSCEEEAVSGEGILAGIAELSATVDASGSATLDTAAFSHFVRALTADTVFSTTSPGTAFAAVDVALSSGGHSATWPASVRWAGGSAPALSAEGTDVITLITYDKGATWYGSVLVADAR